MIQLYNIPRHWYFSDLAFVKSFFIHFLNIALRQLFYGKMMFDYIFFCAIITHTGA